MIIGPHLPNTPNLAQEDRAILTLWRPPGALLMPEHGADVVMAVRDCNPRAWFVARLPNSQGADGVVPSPARYADRCLAYIEEWHRIGIYDFQIDNEPMIQPFWGKDGGWRYQNFMGEVYPLLRRGVPKSARIGFPPLVRPYWQGATWGEQEAALSEWRRACQDLAAKFDWIAVHSYWQSPGDMLNPLFGANATVNHAWHPSKPIIVTEFGNSTGDIPDPGVPYPAIEQIMIAQYPKWVAWAREMPYIEGAYCFLLGGTDQWSKFRISRRVAQALTAAIQ